VKLRRAPELNAHIGELKGTSQGSYRVVGTPFHVVREYSTGWFIWENHSNKHDKWMRRHDLIDIEFSTRAQALDALQMALEGDPL